MAVPRRLQWSDPPIELEVFGPFDTVFHRFEGAEDGEAVDGVTCDDDGHAGHGVPPQAVMNLSRSNRMFVVASASANASATA